MTTPFDTSFGAFGPAGRLPFPGAAWGDYPQRSDDGDAAAPRRAREPAERGGSAARLARVRQQAARWQLWSDAELQAVQPTVQLEVSRDALRGPAAESCCAFVAETALRTLGLAAYDGQLIAALHMLDNRLVEMATGEGKSLAVALAAAMGALAGMPVHVLTANDYLVARDAQRFAPLFARLGLGVATVTAGQSADARRDAYATDIVYVTAKELAFDYLRDAAIRPAGPTPLQQRLADLLRPDAPRRVLRGLCMAIVDEADSLLIDEAQTPLVLSREVPGAAGRGHTWQAWALAGHLVAGADYRVQARQIELTTAGCAHIALLAQPLQPVWLNTRHREEAIVAALTARHLLQRDRDYVVVPREGGHSPRDQEVRIVDATTGRIAEGRRWTNGLHAMVCLKEGCRPEPETETVASITFQRFFRRYHRLGGMSGTLVEARAELARIYGLSTLPVPLRLPGRRIDGPLRVFTSEAARWQAVVRRTRALVAADRPVLIGTDSVAHSRQLSQQLASAGIAHALLDARHDGDEARIVAAAGVAGRVTVSTHMAGRGTDIVPDADALRAGGLHVIACQHNDSHRLDRQLCGRAARQGQPGSAEIWLALDAARFGRGRAWRLTARVWRLFADSTRVRLPSFVLRAALTLLQAREDAHAARRRALLLREDSDADRALAFSGVSSTAPT